jgi:hypothetical protein
MIMGNFALLKWVAGILKGWLPRLLLLGWVALQSHAYALDLLPRRWGYMPIGINAVGVAYAYTDGDITFDPVLRAENVKLESDTWVVQYKRTFKLFDRYAAFDVTQAYQESTWSGLLDKIPTVVERKGPTDPIFRLGINLYGGAPLGVKEFRQWKSQTPVSTRIGAAVAVHVPVGEYLDDKLLNLGNNRFTIRPQLGIVHENGNWAFETTGSVWFFTDNTEFFNGNTLEQDPLYTVQTHIDYDFKPGKWVSLSVGISYGGESYVNRIYKDDRKHYLAWGVSAGYPITPTIGLTFRYINMETLVSTGGDTETLSVAIGFAF